MKELVILDSDMMEFYDDGAAMLLLALSPNIDLLGVTLVTGNNWIESEIAFTLRQLEAVGLEKKVPVFIGSSLPLREGRIEGMNEERKLFGFGRDDMQGAGSMIRPKSWQSEYRSLYHREPQMLPSDEDAVDFIIKTVKEHPNEVTIAAIGPCTNIAKAVLRAPEIVPLIKRIVYMAGVFFQEGNVTHTAEFNCWFDPEAAKISFRTPFNEQIIVPLDVCEKVPFTEKRFEKAEKVIKNPILREMMDRDFRKTMFKEKRETESFIWDLLAAAIIVDPTIITEEVTLPVDVNDTFSLSYGQTVVFKGGAPQGTQKARIILSVDEKKLWNLLFEAFQKM